VSRDEIVDGAAAIVEEGGYDALNMRALAERCGLGTTAIYRQIATKEQLLGVLADRLLTEVIRPSGTPASSWREEIRAVFGTAHRVLREHPVLTEIVAKQHSHGQVGFASAERTMRALRTAGMDGDRAAVAFNALVAYTIGFTQRELHMTTANMGERWAAIQDLPPDAFANVHAFAHALISRPTDAHFDEGLTAIMNGFVGELEPSTTRDPQEVA
jgi:AcrR family transcriptional regulator